MSDDLKALLSKRSDPEAIEALLRDALLYMEKYEAEIERLKAQAAALWQPVPDGDLVPTITDGEMWAYERDGKLGKAIVIQRGNFHGDIILADGYAVCTQRTPGGES
jgi:hypothetical protein